jgi:hypothetical protein
MLSRVVLRVSLLVALFGLVMSRKVVLEWIAPMTATNALVVWYAAFGIFLTLLGYLVFSSKWSPRFTIALLLISWALGIVLYLPISDYSTSITGAQLTGVEAATEDMITYQFLSGLGIHDSSGIITYAVIPFLLLILAGSIVAPNLFARTLRAVVGRA